MWATHDGWMDKSFLTSRIHYKELRPFQPTHLQLMSKSTIFSIIDAIILDGTMVKTTCSHKNN